MPRQLAAGKSTSAGTLIEGAPSQQAHHLPSHACPCASPDTLAAVKPFPRGSYLQGGAANPAGNSSSPYGCSSVPGGGSSIPLLDWTWAPATAVAAMLCVMYRGRVELKEPDLAVHVARIAARYSIVPLYVQAVAAVEVRQERR